MRLSSLLLASQTTAPTPTPPASGNALWYRQPAVAWSKDYLPIGNGYLGAMLSGGTALDQTQLNIESLWSGGPFQNTSYNGGNHPASEAPFLAAQMQHIREGIFGATNGMIDNIDVLTEPFPDYGSYTAAPWLFTALNASGPVSNYTRWLDLDDSTAHTTWSTLDASFARETFCAFPSRACVQHTASSAPAALALAYYFTPVPGSPTPRVTCHDNITLKVRGTAGSPGMTYELLARVQTTPANHAVCTPDSATNASIAVTRADAAWITWVGDTEYAIDAPRFTFRGPDPHDALVRNLAAATAQSYATHRDAHVRDYATGTSAFSLTLGAPSASDLSRPTDELVATYTTGRGSPFLEGLLFNYSRYMLYSSARGVLPANLQGMWGRDNAQPWGADYHANINLQMNYWAAEPTGLDIQQSLWDYMEKTWAPRGAETARVLYNISRGWVTHNEMNIFGHTGMKGGSGSASWSDYPESAVWMMSHVWDHFDYTNDVVWWKSQGWPLLKGVASFHLDRLAPDNTGALVAVPCNSPEQPPITSGCAHQQQILWQMFNDVEKGFDAAGDGDVSFLQEVRDARARMDMGLRIGSWGQLQEWKLDMDQRNDTHREIAHLIGVYPGYALASYAGQTNYSKDELMRAAQVSLVHRGNGTGPDADAGWEKMWRAAAWAQFGDAETFYTQLTYGIERNFGSNLFSLYDPPTPDPIFQIDANLAYPGAVLSALVQAPDVATLQTPLVVTLLPALPAAWGTGRLAGLRVRGGMALDLQWEAGRASAGVIRVNEGARARNVSVVYAGREVDAFVSEEGMVRQLKF